MTLRLLAAALVISEHTVARHMQNIYAKLGLSSRAAVSHHPAGDASTASRRCRP